jgi:hypothetical protein
MTHNSPRKNECPGGPSPPAIRSSSSSSVRQGWKARVSNGGSANRLLLGTSAKDAAEYWGYDKLLHEWQGVLQLPSADGMLVDEINPNDHKLVEMLAAIQRIRELFPKKTLCYWMAGVASDEWTAEAKQNIFTAMSQNADFFLPEWYVPQIDNETGQVASIDGWFAKYKQFTLDVYPRNLVEKTLIGLSANVGDGCDNNPQEDFAVHLARQVDAIASAYDSESTLSRIAGIALFNPTHLERSQHATISLALKHYLGKTGGNMSQVHYASVSEVDSKRKTVALVINEDLKGYADLSSDPYAFAIAAACVQTGNKVYMKYAGYTPDTGGISGDYGRFKGVVFGCSSEFPDPDPE